MPAKVTLISPPNAHVHVQVAFVTGTPPAVTNGTPGVHGAGCGVHGCGVRTPCAAAVALATAGFASEEHMPKEGTFTAALSRTVATGLPSTRTCDDGSTLRVVGAAPNTHCRVAEEARRGAGTPPTLRRPANRGSGRSAPFGPARRARPGSRRCPADCPGEGGDRPVEGRGWHEPSAGRPFDLGVQMSSRPRGQRASWPVAAGLCALAAIVGPLPSPAVVAADVEMLAGTTVWVSGAAEGRPDSPPASTPAVSADGTVVAYSQPEPGEGRSPDRAIVLRGILDGTTTPVTIPGVDLTAPSLDASGDRVVFAGRRWVSSFPDPAHVFLADRAGQRPPERLTGTRGDLRYQRQLTCDPRIFEELIEESSRCGPQLSGDGRTVVFPARLSMVAPELEQVAYPTDGGSETYLGWQGTGLALVDFGNEASSREIDLELIGDEPLRMRLRLSGDAGFAIDEPEEHGCDGAVLDPARVPFCRIVVSFARGESCRTAFGVLDLDTPTSRGRTSVRLVADDLGGCGEGLAGAAPTCEPHAPAPPTAVVEPAQEPVVTVPFGEQWIGSRHIEAVRLSNDPYQKARVEFRAVGCAVQLVGTRPAPPGTPDPVPPDPPVPVEPACRPGLVLAAGATCLAHLSFAPTAVGPHTASVALLQVPSEGEPYVTTRVRAVGAGVREVVVARADRDGDGLFTGEQDPAARALSRDLDGSVVDGWSPAVSHDGSTVAFVSTRDRRLPGPQILLHERGADGQGATTRLVSRFGPGSGGLPLEALQPALSAAGDRVAFTSVRREAAGAAPSTQVHLYDASRQRLVLVSAAAGSDRPSDAESFAPALSADGSTVGYASFARDLLAGGIAVSGTAVFVRRVGPGLAPVRSSANEIVSLRTGTAPGSEASAGLVALSADGAVVVFASRDDLVGAGTTDEQVFARIRHPSTTVTPEAVGLPSQPVGTTGPTRPVTVTNAGPGPAEVSVEVSGPFVLADGCGTAPLPGGGTCVIQVAFAPEDLGPAAGSLTVRATALLWPGSVDVVALTGSALEALLEVEPATVAFPETLVGTDSEPAVLTATNLGSLPMSVAPPPAPDPADFLLAPQTEGGCDRLAPGGSCTLEAVFRPAGLGERSAEVGIVGTSENLTYDATVVMSGTVTQPTLSFSPAVAHEGRVAFVLGEGFLPRLPLELTWDRGPVAVPLVIPDATGAFQAPVVILKGQGPGERVLTVTMPSIDGGVVEAPLLVVPGSAQPPDFVTRN